MVGIELGESVIFQKVNNETVLLNLASQEYYGLNRMGSEIWNLLIENRKPVDAAVDDLAAKYKVDKVRISTDVKGLLSRLTDAGLIRVII